MRQRSTQRWIGVLGAVAVTAFGLSIASCGDAARPASSQVGVPTSSYGKPAKTLADALGQARNQLETGPPFADSVQSVVYVATSVGRARDLFDPHREIGSGRFFTDAPPDSPVWVVVAYGDFVWANRGVVEVPRVSYTAVWFVIPVGETGLYYDASNERYDLSRLGNVVGVPLPLPPFPAPVEVGDD